MTIGCAKILAPNGGAWPRPEALAAASGRLVMCEASMTTSSPGARVGDDSRMEISRPKTSAR
jgi:hypothetical protein